jgi:hypothetical protein
MEQTASTSFKSYFFAHSFTTDATPDDVKFEIASGNGSDTVEIDQSSLLLIDVDDLHRVEGYFDGTVSDPGTAWTDDDNAADGSETTYAFTSTTLEANALQITNNNLETSDDVPVGVWVRVLWEADNSGTTGTFKVLDSSDNELAQAPNFTVGTTKRWSPWHPVRAPSGGWTAANKESLKVKAWTNFLASGDLRVYKVEVAYSFDYVEDINAATGTELSTTAEGTILATIAAADLGTTEEWALFGSARIKIGSTGRWFNTRLKGADDAASASVLNEVQEEGEDTLERRVTGFVGRHKAITSNVAASIVAHEEAANGNMTDQGSYLIALKASEFADFEHDFNNTGLAAQSEVTVASVMNYTPSVNGNHLIIGRTQDQVESDTTFFKLFLEDGTTETRTGDSGPTHCQVWDALKDVEPGYTLERISISAQKTYNLRASASPSQTVLSKTWLLVLNLNKPGVAPPPIRRRKQTVLRM